MDKDFLKGPLFEKQFQQILQSVCNDVAREGQIALPEKMDVSQAIAVKDGKVISSVASAKKNTASATSPAKRRLPGVPKP